MMFNSKSQITKLNLILIMAMRSSTSDQNIPTINPSANDLTSTPNENPITNPKLDSISIPTLEPRITKLLNTPKTFKRDEVSHIGFTHVEEISSITKNIIGYAPTFQTINRSSKTSDAKYLDNSVFVG
jgi:hypothetical protein